MANGSHKPGPALADRIREQGAKHQANLCQAMASEPDEEAETTGQFEVSREGLKVKGVPWWATGIAVVGLVLLAALFVWLKWR